MHPIAVEKGSCLFGIVLICIVVVGLIGKPRPAAVTKKADKSPAPAGH
jgi:hypothetical protein